MKIGAVCEQTGLSDRTVRFYTDEGLLSPSYTKNYLGRKTFDFSEDDVSMLRSIAVLRKYGFSIQEIKSILEDPEKSVEIIAALRQKKQETIRSEQELLDVLLTLEAGKAYTVPELAEALNTPKLAAQKLPEEENDSCFTVLCKIVFWWLTGPLAVVSIFAIPFMLWEYAGYFRYLKLNQESWSFMWGLIGMMIPVMAASFMIALDARSGRMDGTIRQLLIILLTVCHLLFGMPLYVLSVFTCVEPGLYSETADLANYMELGTYEREMMGEKLGLLFPAEIPAYARGEEGTPCPETTRYYNCVDNGWGGNFELFAQWELTEQDLEMEKDRICTELSDYDRTESSVGQWTIWNYSWSDAAMCLQYPDIYEEALDDYSYLFFAYNAESGIVRYIASYSYDATNCPGFLALDWE